MTRFIHVKTPNAKEPRFTLASTYVPEEAVLKIGIAKCSSKEHSFNKKLGRTIAQARMEKKPIILQVEPEANLREITNKFIEEYLVEVQRINGSYNYSLIVETFSPLSVLTFA